MLIVKTNTREQLNLGILHHQFRTDQVYFTDHRHVWVFVWYNKTIQTPTLHRVDCIDIIVYVTDISLYTYYFSQDAGECRQRLEGPTVNCACRKRRC